MRTQPNSFVHIPAYDNFGTMRISINYIEKGELEGIIALIYKEA